MSDNTSQAGDSARFPATSWELVDEAKSRDSAYRLQSLNDLIVNYWKPVFYFVRTKGFATHEAEDLTQEFFLRLIDRDWLKRADAERGRFRTFLLTILVRFLADQRGARARRQTEFEQGIVSISSLLSEGDQNFEPANDASPQDVFQQHWTSALVERVAADVKQHYVAQDKPKWYEIFTTRVLPEPGEKKSIPALAKQFEMTPDQIRYAVSQVRARFEHLLRAEIRREGATEDDVQSELDAVIPAE